MASTQNLKDVTRRVADRLLDHDWKMWFWGDSTGVEGLLDASEILGDPKYRHFVYGLLKGWIGRDIENRAWEYTAPGIALLRVYEALGDPALLRKALSHANYLAGFRQTTEGAYVRYHNAHFDRPPKIPSEKAEPDNDSENLRGLVDGGPCIFVDNMHFDGPFYVRLYRNTNESHHRDLALKNILSSIGVLFDEKADLFYHFWIEAEKRPNGIFWGRGQIWAILGIVQTLSGLPEDDTNRSKLLGVLQRLAKRLIETQDPSGHWHTVIDNPSTYLETSIAAGVTAAFYTALQHGFLDEQVIPTADKALEAALSKVLPDGLVDGVSYETYPSLRTEHYARMPRGARVPWGQGPLLTAIAAYLDFKRII